MFESNGYLWEKYTRLNAILKQINANSAHYSQQSEPKSDQKPNHIVTVVT